MAEPAVGHAEHSKRGEIMGIAPEVRRPLKVVFVGAGSWFLQALFMDTMLVPGAGKGEIALVDIDEERLDLADKLARKVVDTVGGAWKVTSTADRRKVLKGADYVINCIDVCGVETVRFDNDIPLKYGVDQCIGDTVGPGGLFKALRTVPVFLDILRDVKKLCPGAWVLNYTNPMSIMCLAAARAGYGRVVGLCHSVQAATHGLAAMADVPYEEVTWRCAGINHLAWVTQLTHRGRDLYPVILEKIKKKKFYEQAPVQFDMMRHFGYWATESSGHDSEYLPYYRKRPDLLKKYCREGYLGGSGFYSKNWPQWRKNSDQYRRDVLAGKEPIKIRRTWEYASYIIEALETGNPFAIHANVPNRGFITNLSQTVCEVACMVNREGISPTYYGALPPQCAGLCEMNLRMIDLAAVACLTKSREAAAYSLMLDPLTAAVCCPAEIRKMTEEMFRAEADFLPGF